ncbi:Uncharacterised protein [Vibrio cholerae]|nr:Uncharacterised protein [Vibrio cholerae]CSI63143.1 Uncharacterised protein [Vibrio cholerae]
MKSKRQWSSLPFSYPTLKIVTERNQTPSQPVSHL